MPVEIRKTIVKLLLRGGLCKSEIAQRLGVPLAAVKEVAERLWQRSRDYDYASRPNPWTR